MDQNFRGEGEHFYFNVPELGVTLAPWTPWLDFVSFCTNGSDLTFAIFGLRRRDAKHWCLPSFAKIVGVSEERGCWLIGMLSKGTRPSVFHGLNRMRKASYAFQVVQSQAIGYFKVQMVSHSIQFYVKSISFYIILYSSIYLYFYIM